MEGSQWNKCSIYLVDPRDYKRIPQNLWLVNSDILVILFVCLYVCISVCMSLYIFAGRGTNCGLLKGKHGCLLFVTNM